MVSYCSSFYSCGRSLIPLAISIFRQQEYAQAGLWVFSNDYGLDSTRAHILIYTIPLVGIPAVLWNLGIASWATAISGATIGGWMLWQAFDGWHHKKEKSGLENYFSPPDISIDAVRYAHH